ncbi:MAG: hypothetical protein KJ989_20595 [Gammaproteobacteria bacterium]|nr:hypothetical protein [Gammaproteobacteria bacterium]MBU2256763.1 hypothetical protein [Gammaproteobacteria bacterium]MBU2296596.1 hypothetical protein [Gammaproteobacteria bacterium]
MKSVYILHHVHDFADGHEDQKIIGVFSSEENAEAARDLVKTQPGFSNTPEGFEIAEWQLDRAGWLEGYVSI